MKYKIAAAGDLHKKHKDVSTIKGYVKCCDAVQEDLIRFIKNEGITHFIELGDWYDRGYVDDISSALADVSREEYMNYVLNGNFYGVIGNHIRLRLDSNPELTLIQPHPYIKSRKEVKREEPVIKTPSTFTIGNVQISLVHHIYGSERVTEYSVPRLPGIKYHIAFMHDDKFVPNYMLSKISHPNTNSLDSQIAEVLDDVDLCICGHIHMPLGMFDISPKTKMYIPGSLTNTNAGIKSRHSMINIPVIEIDDETDAVNISFYPFDLKLNMVTFDEKGEEKVTEKLKSIRGNSIKQLYSDKSMESIMSSGLSSLTFSSFLKSNGYTELDKSLIQMCIKDPSNVRDIMKKFKTENEVTSEV